jgi:dUTPase
MEVKVKLFSHFAKVPTLNAEGKFDVYSITTTVIPKHGTRIFDLGFALELPPFTTFKIEGITSLAISGLFPTSGVHDFGGNGSVAIVMHNASRRERTVFCGQKIGQLIVYPQIMVTLKQNGPTPVNKYDGSGQNGYAAANPTFGDCPEPCYNFD